MFIFNMDLVITKKTESLFLKKLCHSYVKEYEIEKSVYL